MDPKSVQGAKPASERAVTPVVALTTVLPSAASPASLKTSRARSQARCPRANRLTRYAPRRPSSVLPAAMTADVATEPAVVMLTRKAPTKMAGQTS